MRRTIGRAWPASMLFGLLALSGCGTPGNYTDYTVSCRIGEASTRSLLRAEAEQIAAKLHGDVQIGMDDKEQLYIYIRQGRSFWRRPLTIILRRVTDYQEIYTVSVEREGSQTDDQDVLFARGVVESALDGSMCPQFDRRVRYSLPAKLT